MQRAGFTLIELLVVIAVLGVLAAGVFVAINPLKRINQANDSRIKTDIGQIAQSLQTYYVINQSYPAGIADLVTSGDLKTEPKTPSGTPYSYTPSPNGCATLERNCTEATVQAPLNDPKTPGAFWQWSSVTNIASEIAAPAPTATGGTSTQSGADTIYTFTSSGTFTAKVDMNVEVLVVGGGGGGAWGKPETYEGGGGGGGGVVVNNPLAVLAGSYTVTVGAGGAGGASGGNAGLNGESSSFGSLVTATGGGGGGEWGGNAASAVGRNGGSGGGGGTAGSGGSGTSGQGNNGGAGAQGSRDGGGGGGGGGASGGNATAGGSSVGGAGGAGLTSSISGVSVIYAGGGGGGGDSGGAGGAGGGGAQGNAGTPNTGGGGGGGRGGAGQAGGLGIVIIRYLTP